MLNCKHLDFPLGSGQANADCPRIPYFPWPIISNFFLTIGEETPNAVHVSPYTGLCNCADVLTSPVPAFTRV